MAGEPTKRVFLRNCDSGEPACYCGKLSDKADVIKSIGHVLDGEIDEAAFWVDSSIEFRLEVRLVTDQDVEALPSL